ncbi:hypothetical protein LTR47_009445 [Exophiala xenobiotica]|nr:hypothetical protein LTR41_008572 [Exophiala xenobiotica]KAK5225383.1 hypothetical protein LTR47_009445 [Exophiala xenobiotica]KAK5318626.1 hypothetical protein LTR93_008021 [Exophiala xenobiotica]KAK5348850.1 hypothetical protein LTR61_007431 [Exophiala xenobiotica]KAK5403132.1 hypothetical protein LTR06_010225 [Exophiala xenobiotica]
MRISVESSQTGPENRQRSSPLPETTRIVRLHEKPGTAQRQGSTTRLPISRFKVWKQCQIEIFGSSPTVAEPGGKYLDALAISCDCLGLTLVQLDRILPRYFEVYSTFQLFRLPELETKLRKVPTTSQRTSLLASLLAFGVKGLGHHEINDLAQDEILTEAMGNPSIYFRQLAIKYMDRAMVELGDEPVTLSLLQAMILNTHCLLVQGVRGRAWRYLGICIRSAYELNMHLIDANKAHDQDHYIDAEQWCIEEEWRRAWWAIWEMDVFASFIRRCPTGIDWSQNKTFLPAEDEKWYQGKPQPSCVLEVHLVQRWKSLVATQNQSPKAWFIVINSLMKEAQDISSPTITDEFPLPNRTQVFEKATVKNNQHQKQMADANRLDTILNCLHCTVMALPSRHCYYGQSLNFGERDGTHHGPQVLADSSVYEIYLMVQLTRMMVLKYHVFRTGLKWQTMRDLIHNDDIVTAAPPEVGAQHLTQYFEAADCVVKIVRCSSGDHYKHVNPFLASTAWLAGAVQLFHRSLLPDDSSDRDLTDSNFEVVSLTYQRCVDYWNMSKVPLRNWETLATGLESKEPPHLEAQYYHTTPWTFTGGNSKPSHDHATGDKWPLSSRNQPGATGEPTMPDQVFQLYDTRQGNDLNDRYHTAAFNTQSQPHLLNRSATNNDNVAEHVLRQIEEPEIPPLVLDTGHDQAPFEYTQTHNTMLPNILGSPNFATDRAMNIDFFNYFDEMFSGSYMP